MIITYRYFIAGSLSLWVFAAGANQTDQTKQRPPEQEEQLIQEVIVTSPSIKKTAIFDTNYKVSAISREAIRDNAYRSVPQALRNTPGIVVQETSFGQGSPFIRGFTGFRNVFLIDGIKLNNSTFREGPNQYWSTIDAYGVTQLEVISGPSSVLYGSDAIGGAVYAVTGREIDSELKSHTRLSSAENSVIQRVSGSLELSKKTALTLGATGKDFGNLRGGDEIGEQGGIGYTEWTGDIKLINQLGDWTLDLFHQQLRQNNVPRTHKTQDAEVWEGTSAGSDQKRELDQYRSLTYLRAKSEQLPWLDSFSITASLSKTEESRDRVRGNGRRELQGFDVDTVGLLTRGVKESQYGRWTFGIDYYDDTVDSFSSRNAIQGPVADDASYTTFDAYIYDEVRIGAVDLNGGVRYTSAEADADSVSDPVTAERISLKEDWSDLVGSIGAGIELVPDTLRAYTSIRQGFRSPNLSDLTRFDTARSNEFEIPSPDLEPEKFAAYEIGLKYRSNATEFQLATYYTDVEDMIVRFPTGVVIDGEHQVTKDNIGDGYVAGIELNARTLLTNTLSLSGRLSWMDSEVSTYPTSEQVLVDEPISREAPLMGGLTLRHYVSDVLWWEGALDFAEKADDLSTRDQSDTSRIPPGGTPSYSVVHLRAGYILNERVSMNFNIDNVLNEDYRVHGSGTNMPGRNFILGVEITL